MGLKHNAALPFGGYKILSNGNKIPQLGFGVYEVSGSACISAVTRALEAGYRHIDSAEWYNNEDECGKAITSFIHNSRGSVTRSDIFFTSKLMSLSTYEHAKRSIAKSVRVCGLEYIDLYLLHSPYPNREARLESWRACEDAVDAGLVKNIGVSNFGSRHLTELFASHPRIPPVLNQIDVHPFMTRTEEALENERLGLAVEAWGPLARGERMQDPVLRKIAKAKGKSVAQIMIRWSLQRGFVCIPKSVTPARIIQNTEVFDFELSEAEMTTMNGLDEYLVTDWDPIGDKRV